MQYNIEKNTYTCSNNRILPYKKTYDINGKKRKVFYTKDCKNCQYKEECTPHSNYRIISHYSTSYQDLMSQKNG
ncbi:transposase [Methanobrevibacter cuticularis]|uniref:transposase n=1 Tax=Methanobrevibacter cuticularis TaxID=47311 RepID=UPI00147214CC|nr:transposase [Methanobrevibacter cuticularis]